MKHIRLLAVAAAFAAVSLTCLAQPPNYGPVNFKLFSIQTNIFDQQSGFTNATSSTSSNFLATSLYTTATTNLNNQELLKMLANSYNVTWPAGATLKADGSGEFDVVNGTTLVQNVNDVLTLSNINSGGTAMYSGSQVAKGSITSNGVKGAETTKYTETVLSTLIYDDSAFSTANGVNTQITVNGIETIHGNMVMSTTAAPSSTEVVSFIGSGLGTNYSSAATNWFIVGGSLNATSSGGF